MMKKLFFKSFLLLNAIIPFILTGCPEYPTIPNGTPRLLTSASEGFSNFPTSTQELSVTMWITPKEACNAQSKFHLFSAKLGTGSDYIETYIDCTTLEIVTELSWSTLKLGQVMFTSSTFDLVGIFLSFGLGLNGRGTTGKYKSETHRMSDWRNTGLSAVFSHPYFDASTQFYFCADKNGVSQACTVSDIVFEYQFYELEEAFPHLTGINPAVAALYPLAYESLAPSTGPAASAYFGDKVSNPSTSTSPTWDSSKAFVSLTSGQFLTFPLPDLSYPLTSLSSSFSFSAWVKITDLPSPVTTLFAIYSADGTQFGYKLTVDQSSNEIQLTFTGSSQPIPIATPFPRVTLGQWQLIGFATFVFTAKNVPLHYIDGTIFVGTSSSPYHGLSIIAPLDIPTGSVIRVGDAADSFTGEISIVRITTPGGGIIRTTNICSSNNIIELGVDSFALACSGSNYLNAGECVSSCPSDTRPTSDTAVRVCVPCPQGMHLDGSICKVTCPLNCAECDVNECKACNDGYQLNSLKECVLKPSTPTLPPTKPTITKEESGLSGGVIAGIVCGSLLLLLTLCCCIILVAKRRSKKKKEVCKISKGDSKTKFCDPETSPGDINVRAISPINSEANPLVP